MLHAVLFLVLAGEFVLLNHAVQIVVDVSCHHNAVLSAAVHGLGIDVIVLLGILHEPALLLEHIEVFNSLGIDFSIVFVGNRVEIDFRFDDVIQRHLIAQRFVESLLRVEHIVGARSHFGYEVLWRAQALEWFN